MKKLFRLLTEAAAAVLMMTAMTVLSVSAYAEDYEFDVSTAKESTGWQQSFVHYTVLGDPSMKDNFNPTWMTEDSEIIITYESSGEYANYPCELIWQTWGDLAEGVKGTWNKVAPYEFDDTTSKFSYQDVVDAYGVSDFSTVYAICVGDRNNVLKVTGMTITNCDIPSEAESEEEAKETEAAETEAEETEAETAAETTEKVTEAKNETEATTAETLPVPQTEDDEEGGVDATMVILIVVVVVVAAAIVVIIILMIKKAKNRYY